MQTPSLKEDHISQIPALELLQKMGYNYITPEEAFIMRGDTGNVILDEVVLQQLPRLNRIKYLGQTYDFEQGVFPRALDKLKDFPLVEGTIRTNEKVYDLLTLGTSFEQNIGGDKRSFNLRYIDWDNPENNVYHVTEEYEVRKPGSYETRRPDIVLFVNGIPLVVIECKRPDLKGGSKDAISQAIQQHLRNQKEDQIPDLFKYSQILLAICGNDARYGTTGSEERFWAFWREQNDITGEVYRIKNTPLTAEQKDRLLSDRYSYVRKYFEQLDESERQVTEQDRALFSLLSHERLLELTYRFLVYDAGVKKIARYQQYFAVKNTINRVRHLDHGKRHGGVIWHTQGSGKSLTMVMMAKVLALEKNIIDQKIILVTDRVDLDDQIYKTFHNCGKGEELVQAKSGRHLMDTVRAKKASIITTVLFKFDTAVRESEFVEDSPNIFVLVDESHRSQYGEANIKMQRVFPNACYIGFTGTPLMKKEKSTAMKFGGFIDKYTIDQAVKDKAVVPLLYEGREAKQNILHAPIDKYFEKISEPLTEYQRADLKKKYANAEHLSEAEQRIYAIAWDITDHYINAWQGTGFKGQLTASSKAAAIKFLRFFREINRVSVEVLISPPDTREGSETIYEESDDKDVNVFWKNMMSRFGNADNYKREIINSFKYGEEPEIIIVVDMLLTGFDAPKNIVLYIARSLREHSLLQAIARVNRLHEGKDYGYIIDYEGILENLDQALTTYSSLDAFEQEDLEGTMTSVKEEIIKLAEYHTQLWDLFRQVENKRDLEAYEQYLGDEDLRLEFYDRLSKFSRTLKLAMSTDVFFDTTSPEKIKTYKEDAKFFLQLRVSVKGRYSESIDYKEYEKQVQKLIDQFVSTDEVIQITRQVNIFEKEAFEQELDKISSTAKQADTIASRTAKHISEKMDEDPAFYRKFSQMLQDIIDEYRYKRSLQTKMFGETESLDQQYLEKLNHIKDIVLEHRDDSLPEMLVGREDARAFFGVIKESVGREDMDEVSARIALEVENIVRRNKVVDWQMKRDVQDRIRQQVNDVLFDIRDETGMEMTLDRMDEIIEKTLEVAKVRFR